MKTTNLILILTALFLILNCERREEKKQTDPVSPPTETEYHGTELKTFYLGMTTGEPCQEQPKFFIPIYAKNLKQNDTVFLALTKPINGGGLWWLSEGGKYSYRIGTDGIIQARAECE